MKLKFGPNSIELLNNSKSTTDIKIGFSFDHNLLTNTKKHTGLSKPGKFDDLSKPGKTASLGKGQIILSLGNKEEFTLATYISALDSLAAMIQNNTTIVSLSLILEEGLSKSLNYSINEFNENTVFHFLNGLYSFEDCKTNPKKLSLKLINIITMNDQKSSLHNALSLTEGVFLTKNLAHSPANIATPSHLAKTAKGFEKLSKQVKVEILEEKEARKLGMNTFLAVARGADSEPKFIKMEYFGTQKNKKPIVLIGKGITFDSGGISLKPGANMDDMKYDMCGAATVLGLFQTVVKLELPINLVGLVPSCENMPSGKALKPGDVITTLAGKTVEIPNTDAEGRLILCDALAYAAKFKPELVIDMATLTGACVVALGKVSSALFSNDDELAAQLIQSGLYTNDKVWRMPLFKEYHEMLKGKTADLSNIGSWRGEAACVTAACFLEQFTSYKWAHLDVAGTAMGGSGRPFYLMIDFLRRLKK